MKKESRQKTATVIVHSGDYDRVVSAFMVGNGYLSMGYSVTFFFTFGGLHVLKRKGFKYTDFTGIRKYRMKKKIKKYNLASLAELAESYKKLGGTIVADTMTMEAMGIAKGELMEDLIDTYGTLGEYCSQSAGADINLFI